MLGAERFLSDGQRSFVERFSLLILPLVSADLSEVVEGVSDIGMLSPKPLLEDGQSLLVE
jgi:hypothetical protein